MPEIADLARPERLLEAATGAPPEPEPRRAEDGRADDLPSLDRRIAGVCARLAALLEQLVGAVADQAADSVALLAALRAHAEGEPSRAPAYGRLLARLTPSPAEIDLLVLAGLAEEHEGLAVLFRLLHPRGEPRPTLGLAARLFCEDLAERRLLLRAAEVGPLARFGVLDLVPADAPAFERTLAPAPGIWSVLRGIDLWPELVGIRPGPAALAGLDGWLAGAAAGRAVAAIQRRETTTILVSSDREDLAHERAVALAEASGRPWVRLRPVRFDVAAARLLGIHALVRDVIPVVGIRVEEGPAGADAPELGDLPIPVVIAARRGAVRFGGSRSLIAVGGEDLSAADRRRMWAQLVPGLPPDVAAEAARHRVEPAQARQTADDLRLIEEIESRSPGQADILDSIRARGAIETSSGIKVLRPTATWSGLVLPADRLSQLREAVDRLHQQDRVLDDWQFLAGRPGARGVRVMFSGPPGTGKTLAAEVLASELGLELLIVDVARVVSKWIGETEKNLADVFDAAERFHGVLLFDEADALFAKRTDATDAHARYANMESAYLLGRLERYEGLVILSTNLRSNIDPAFTRRLEISVVFDEPTVDERRALWRRHIPAAAPLASDVDLAELAELFPVVGGVIRNAAVAAAFLAAASGGPIRREHVLRAVRREYEKHGKAFPAIPIGSMHAEIA